MGCINGCLPWLLHSCPKYTRHVKRKSRDENMSNFSSFFQKCKAALKSSLICKALILLNNLSQSSLTSLLQDLKLNWAGKKAFGTSLDICFISHLQDMSFPSGILHLLFWKYFLFLPVRLTNVQSSIISNKEMMIVCS